MYSEGLLLTLEMAVDKSSHQNIHAVVILELSTVSHSLPRQMEFAMEIWMFKFPFLSQHGREVLKVLIKMEI